MNNSSEAVAVRLDDVRKTYRTGEVEVQAVRGVSIEIGQGEFVALMGSSGSGKSTLMNILGCLDRPTSGRYFLDGDDVSGLSRDELADVRNRKLGFVFQNFNLLSRTSALENVELPLLYSEVALTSEELREKAEQVLASVGLEGRGDHTPSQLSGGQQQRVALARALVKRPHLLLLDEPLSNLDAGLRLTMRTEIRRIQRELGVTTILVTHDQIEATTMADRVVVMNGGRVEQEGAADDLYERPDTLFVASFIGSPPMNLIPMDGKLLGVRPEHMEPCAASEAMLTIDVDLIEPLGADIIVYGHVGDRDSARVAARLPADAKAQAGKLALRYAPQHVHWFDPVSGKRIDA